MIPIEVTSLYTIRATEPDQLSEIQLYYISEFNEIESYETRRDTWRDWVDTIEHARSL